MKIYLSAFIVLMGLMLGSCGRSPDSQFYVLSPIAPLQNQIKSYKHLKIGLNEIKGPAYLSKPQVIVHYSANEVKLEEYHRWVENLDKNVKQVIVANLSTLLPGAAFISMPWDIKFRPKYQLQIDISQFEVDVKGNSLFSADYTIYADKQVYTTGTLVYRQKVSQPKIENLVASMNENLNHFSRDLAKVLAKLQ
ncbi:ABC-type uncharacterized transport system, auxiliary component [Legionella massiliensis]|uniref:ABC-type uncharacterized transport system, auxiliary component n=1 Tax=Legionella massiliensis TaxID=1034943 RepID=A0A078KZB3_9GAMM|nr:PqiC family protein [Legionella massiliensis]CDZ77078.1 ABC-type uncharacterized transport system, auxiliary component [Legionella massiliensis]CEE12816.1 hypothetical protein BN1094_01357 [Legionella massiliensis]